MAYEPLKAGLTFGILTALIVYLCGKYNPAVVGLLATFPLSIIYLFFLDNEKSKDFAKMYLLGSLVYISAIFIYYQLTQGYGKKSSLVISLGFWMLSAIALYFIFIHYK